MDKFVCSKGKHCEGCSMSEIGDPICQAKHYRFDEFDDADEESVDEFDDTADMLRDLARDEALLASLDK